MRSCTEVRAVRDFGGLGGLVGGLGNWDLLLEIWVHRI